MKKALIMLIALMIFSTPLRAQDATIPLPASVPAAIGDGSATRIDVYPPDHLLHLKIHLAALDEDQKPVLDSLLKWLKDNGMTVTATDKQTIELNATAQTVETVFQVGIDQYEIHSLLYYANSQPPAIPISLNGVITGIDGLNDFPPPSN